MVVVVVRTDLVVVVVVVGGVLVMVLGGGLKHVLLALALQLVRVLLEGAEAGHGPSAESLGAEGGQAGAAGEQGTVAEGHGRHWGGTSSVRGGTRLISHIKSRTPPSPATSHTRIQATT